MRAAVERVAQAPLAAFALIAAAALVRVLLTRQNATPWIFVDELLHSELAKNVAAGHGFDARGAPISVSYLYPLLVAPAWWLGSMAATYALAKAIGAVLFALGAVVVWAWGRRLLSPRGALLATALTLLLPFFALAGTLSTETAFFPAFLLACLAIARALERPTLARQALALAAIGLAVAARFQGVVLVAVLATGALALRERRLWPSGAVVLAAAVAWIAVHGFALGVYTQATDARYSAGSLARWLVYTPGIVALVVGVAPAAALLALLLRPARGRAERAFLVVAGAAVLWSCVLAGVSGSWLPAGVKERYAIHALPLLLLALVLWIERGMPGPRWVVAVPLALVAALPFGTIFASASFPSNGIDLYAFQRLDVHVGHVRELAIAGAVVAAALFLLRRRELVVLLAAYLALGSAAAQATVRSHSLDAARLAGPDGASAWIDAAAGKGADVAILNTTNFEPETNANRLYLTWTPVWQYEIWNRSLRSSLGFGFEEPAPLPQRQAHLDFATGRVEPAQRLAYGLADRRFEPDGTQLAAHGGFALWRTRAPLRFAGAEEGVWSDGTIGGTAAYSRWVGGPGTVVVRLAGSGRAELTAGAPVPLGAGQAEVGRIDARRAVALPAVVRLAVRPPVRVEVELSDPPGKAAFAWER
jgi:hypothetical protein